MAKKMSKNIILILPLLITILAVLSGCGTSTNSQLNPYVFLTGVDSVDHTPFFLNAYQAFQVAGLSVGLTEEQIKALEEEQKNQTKKSISR